MRPTAYIIDIKQFLVVSYINFAPGVHIGHALGVICAHRLILKNWKTFSETIRPTAQVKRYGLIEPLVSFFNFQCDKYGYLKTERTL